MKRLWLVLCTLGALAAGTALAQRPQIVIATGGTGGVYFFYGTQLAQMLSTYTDLNSTAIQTAASIDNLLLIRDKTNPGRNTYYCALTLPDSALVAFEGTHEKFVDKPAPIATLWMAYPNYLQIVTTAASGIKDISDLAGKRVSTGAPSSGTEFTSLMVLDAAGIETEGFSVWARLGAAESAEGLASGTLDAYFWSGGVPTGSISELAATLARTGRQIALVEVAPDSKAVKTFEERFPGLGDVLTISKDVYGSPSDTNTFAFWNIMACADSMPDDVAYTITKTAFEHLDELVAAVPPAIDTNVENNVRFIGHTTIPYHDGALRYFKEIGAIE